MNTQTEYNEDDTFNALRRMPRSQLEKEDQQCCTMIARNEWRLAKEQLELEKEQKKARFMSKFSFIFGRPELILMSLSLKRENLAGLYDPLLKPRGWTTEDYGSLIYKEALEVHRHNEKARSEKIRVITLIYLCVVFISLMANIFLASVIATIVAPIVIGFAGGFVVTKTVKHYKKREIGIFGSL